MVYSGASTGALVLVNVAPPGASHQAASLPIPRGEEASRGLMVGILSEFSQSVTILDSLWVFTAQLLAFDQVEPSRGESKSSWMMGEAAVPSYKKDKQCHFTRRINSAIIKKESSADPQSPMARSWQRQRWLMAASPRSWPQMGDGAGGGGQESEPSRHRPPSHIFYTSPPLQSLPRLKTSDTLGRNKHRDSLPCKQLVKWGGDNAMDTHRRRTTFLNISQPRVCSPDLCFKTKTKFSQ